MSIIPDLGEFSAFIVASYAITALVTLGLVLWAILGEHHQQHLLSELEKRGLTRGRGAVNRDT
jgi:heme exporter protein CcmD